MSRTIYLTATTLDGFLADPDDSLEWLFVCDAGDLTPVPPFTAFTNSKPVPRGSGSMRRNTSPNWPAPPVCFLWR